MYTSTAFLVASFLATTALAAPYSTPNTTTTTPPPAATPTPAPVPAPASGLTLFQQLLLAPNAVERSKLLPDDNSYVFNFNSPPPTSPESINPITKGLGGRTVRADHATFPALVGSGGAMVLGFLGPCGFNTPHVHPRAAEFNLVVEGRLGAQVVFENGARTITHEEVGKYELTIFPQGAVHTEFNPDCTDAVFVAAFPDEDPGVGQIAQEYFGLSGEVIKASMGGDVQIDGKDVDAFKKLIPANVAMGVETCLKKCGIKKRGEENV